MTLAGIPVRVLWPWVRAYLVVTFFIWFWNGSFDLSSNPLLAMVALAGGDTRPLLTQLLWDFIPNLMPITSRMLPGGNYLTGYDLFAGYVRFFGFLSLKIVQIILIISFIRKLFRGLLESTTTNLSPLAIELLYIPTWLTPVTMTFGVIITLSAILFTSVLLGAPFFRGGSEMTEVVIHLPIYAGLYFGIFGTMSALRFNASAADRVMAIAGGSSLTPEHPLAQRVQTLANRIRLPPVAVTTMSQMNAFAIGSSRKTAAVALGQPLVSMLEPDEVDAVIGHELGHIVSSDMNRLQLAMGYDAMFDSLGRSVAAASQASIRDRDTGTLVGLLIHFLRSTVLISSKLVTRYISRMREYRADAIGAALSSPEAMIRALERIHGVKQPPTPVEEQYGYLMFRGSTLARLFSTHPTLEQRVRKLKKGGLRFKIGD